MQTSDAVAKLRRAADELEEAERLEGLGGPKRAVRAKDLRTSAYLHAWQVEKGLRP